jgi:hypothetical protein
MNKRAGSLTGILLLLFTPRALAQGRPAAMSEMPQLTISVYDYAGVPASFLIAAEADVERIFRRAGLETQWLNCGRKAGAQEPKACPIVDGTHLVVKILPHALSPQARKRSEVLGAATVDEKGTSYYAYAFYDRVRQLAEERRLGHELLGAVVAHEIGHLLLGSNAHSVSGVMCGRWERKERRDISDGAMGFFPEQARAMRDRVRQRWVEQTALAQFVSGAQDNGTREPAAMGATAQRDEVPQ